MKQLTSLKECEMCEDPCCRFHVSCRNESPLFTNEEYLIALDKKISKDIFKKKGRNTWQLKLSKWEKGYLVCPLIVKGKYCKLKNDRPFDCKIWPFQIVKHDKRIFLGYDQGNTCPGVSKKDKKTIEKHAKNLINYLESKEITQMFKKYPKLKIELDEDIELIKELKE